ncbi:MAG: YeeE/YedE family protein [Bdellovibrionales bacterium]|nr:YeeE/YedE family protein [Bdellovibrionales bacterium]
MMNAVIGGILIGLAVSLMLLFNGRVTGISGILGGIIKPQKNDLNWRVAFIGGLVFGGFILQNLRPEAFIQLSSAVWFDYVIAGILVGFGTLLGNGCTSGHGVCGISRLSIRSIIATLTFIVFGMISIIIFKFVRGSL